MEHLQPTQTPVAKAEMLIRRPVAEVFEALINPTITTKFWFTRSSGRLEPGSFRKSSHSSGLSVYSVSCGER